MSPADPADPADPTDPADSQLYYVRWGPTGNRMQYVWRLCPPHYIQARLAGVTFFREERITWVWRHLVDPREGAMPTGCMMCDRPDNQKEWDHMLGRGPVQPNW